MTKTTFSGRWAAVKRGRVMPYVKIQGGMSVFRPAKKFRHNVQPDERTCWTANGRTHWFNETPVTG